MRHTAIAACLATSFLPIEPSLAQVLASAAVPSKLERYIANADTTVVAQIQPLSSFEAEQERMKKANEGKPKAFEDKYFDSSALPASADDDNAAQNDGTGFRSYFVETRRNYASSDGTGIDTRRGSELGLRTEYRFDTLNFGEYVIQADLRSQQGDSSINNSFALPTENTSKGRFTIRNLGFPLTANTFADTSVGDISSETTDALMRNYRFSLGNSTVRGVSTRVYNRDMDVRAGVGERGNMVGGPYPAFEATQGKLAWLGLSQRYAGNIYAGLQLNQNQGTLVQTGAFSSSPTENVTQFAATVGYGHELSGDGDKKTRITVLQSYSSAAVEGRNKSATGVFLEGGFKTGRYRNELGAYWTAPGLRYGDFTVETGSKGGYWRVDHSTSRLNLGAGLDYEQLTPPASATQAGSRRLSLSFNAQNYIDRDSSVGMNLNYIQNSYTNNSKQINEYADYSSKSYYLSSFYQLYMSDWGRSRLTATLRRNQTLVSNGVAATGEELAWEHDWVTGKYETMRPELTTTIGYVRDRSEGETQTYPTAGVTFRYWPDADWNLGGNLHYSSRSGNLSTSRGLSGSLSTERILGAGWRMGGSVNLNQAVVNVTGSTLNAPSISRSNEKSVNVYLRYDGASGTSSQAMGARGVGAGRLTGIVYFDNNRDNIHQSNELGVPNVEVVLDGRYRTSTDKDGRYEFPAVATGSHRVSIKLESVPLPWGATQDRDTIIDVPLRGQASLEIPVVRVTE